VKAESLDMLISMVSKRIINKKAEFRIFFIKLTRNRTNSYYEGRKNTYYFLPLGGHLYFVHKNNGKYNLGSNF